MEIFMKIKSILGENIKKKTRRRTCSRREKNKNIKYELQKE